MQTVSTAFANATLAAHRNVSYKLQIKWSSTFVDETDHLEMHWNGKHSLSAPTKDLVRPGDVGKLSLVLRNQDNRYDYDNPASPLYGIITEDIHIAGRDVLLSVSFVPGEWVTIFTGVISAWSRSEFPAQISVECSDVGWKYLQDKKSSSVSYNMLSSEWIVHLSTLAGIQSPIIATGLFRTPICWLDDESIIEEIWEMAQSDGGYAWFDELGRLHFDTITTWVLPGNSTSVFTFDAGDWGNVEHSFNMEDIVSKVICEWSSREVGPEAVIYTLDSLKLVRPNSYIDIDARFKLPAARVIDPVSDHATDYYIASTAGANMSGSVTVTLPAVYSQRATIRITNNHASLTAMVNKLQLRGSPIIGGPQEQVEIAASTNPLALNRVRTIRGNAYIQTEAQAYALASALAERHKKFITTYRVRELAGVPHLQLRDFVTITTPTRTVTGWVTSISFRCNGGGFEQDIEIIGSDGYYDYTNYFQIGISALDGTKRAWH